MKHSYSLSARSWGLLLASGLFLGLLLAILFARTMDLRFNHDEHQFVASGVLLAREGLLPYRDYPHFHMPNLVFVNALLFRLTDYYLLAARTVSVLSGWLLLVSLYFVALRLFRGHSSRARFLIGAGMVLLLGASPMLVYTSGRAWNHDLPAMLSMAAFLLLVYGVKRPPSLLWLGLSGFLAGFAASTRLTALLLAAPLFLAIWLWPNRAPLRQRLWGGLAFVAGALLASLPAFYFLAFDRDKFLFGNLEYAWLNTQYRATEGYALRMTLPDKLVYFGFDVLLKRTGNLLVALAYLLLGLPLLKRSAPGRAELWLIGGLLAAAAVGALAPTPSWLQYYFILFPFFAVGALYGLRYVRSSWLTQRWFQAASLGAVVLSMALVAKDHRDLGILVAPAKWLPVSLHVTGQKIAELAGAGARVLTLAPALVLEGGGQIYPLLTDGPFPLRVAPLLTPEEQQAYGLVAADNLEPWLASQPPSAILTGVHDEDLVTEAPLVRYARSHAYTRFTLDHGEKLWLRPLAQWGSTLRLVTAPNLPTQLTPGAAFSATLFLDSSAAITEDLNVVVRLVDAQGETVFQVDGWPWGRPTSTWRPQEIWYDGHVVRVPADASPGLYRLEVDFYDPQRTARLPVTDLRTGAVAESAYPLTYLVVGPWPPAPAQPLTPAPLFGGAASLVGYDLAPAGGLQPGDRLQVQLHWLPQAPLAADLTTFVQLIGPDGVLAAQHDKPPLDGFYPTSRWQPGQPIVDTFTLALPETALPGEYTIYAGLYDLATGERTIGLVGEEVHDAWPLVKVMVGAE